MSNPSNILRPITLALVFGWVFWTPLSAVAQQASEKTFKQGNHNTNDPVRIVDIKASDRHLKLDEKFNGQDDWLRGAEIRLKNLSDKDVVYIDLRFNFPETTSSGNEMSFTTELGNSPGIPVHNAPLLLRPNEEVSFILNKEDYDSLVKFVGARHKISEINKTDLVIGFVVFEDLTAWGSGLSFKQDPNNLRRWLPINKEP